MAWRAAGRARAPAARSCPAVSPHSTSAPSRPSGRGGLPRPRGRRRGAPPLLHSGAASGTVETVGSGAPPPGTFAAPRYVRDQVEIAAGDLLVVYTDGVTEMRNDHGQDYGEDRLRRAIARAAPG